MFRKVFKVFIAAPGSRWFSSDSAKVAESHFKSFTGFNIKTLSRVGRPLYMDVQATTPLDFRVLDAMLPYLTNSFGNPHSKSHEYGWEGEEGVEKGRAQIARLIGADPREVIFTSGATESNNTALKGLCRFHRSRKRHIITVQTEHKCVLDTCRHLEEEGFSVTYLPVQSNGLVDLDLLRKSIKPETLVVSVMTVNNEIGVIQDIKAIGKLCREHGVYFHTDAAQAVGKIPINVDEFNIDLLSISGHKIYGPKGIGALYIRKRPKVRILPLINGGGQEFGMRSGTLAPALCVGLGAACEVASKEMENDKRHIRRLFDRLLNGIRERVSHIQVNGDVNQRYCGNLNVSFAYIEGESLLMALKNVALSSGSACTSTSLEPSYVLRALGVQDEMAHTSIRFGLGRFTTEAEVDFLLDTLKVHVDRLRNMSPLWEMVQEGIDLNTIEWSQPH